jgi:hypothetical protein
MALISSGEKSSMCRKWWPFRGGDTVAPENVEDAAVACLLFLQALVLGEILQIGLPDRNVEQFN